jgi:hypothetical protein
MELLAIVTVPSNREFSKTSQLVATLKIRAANCKKFPVKYRNEFGSKCGKKVRCWAKDGRHMQQKYEYFPIISLHNRETQTERGSDPTVSTATTFLHIKHADAVREIARVRAVLVLEL